MAQHKLRPALAVSLALQWLCFRPAVLPSSGIPQCCNIPVVYVGMLDITCANKVTKDNRRSGPKAKSTRTFPTQSHDAVSIRLAICNPMPNASRFARTEVAWPSPPHCLLLSALQASPEPSERLAGLEFCTHWSPKPGSQHQSCWVAANAASQVPQTMSRPPL